jgi:hypothetical protein
MPSEATKGSWALDKILTYRYVKPWVQWFPNEEDPLTDPSGMARGLARTLWQTNPAELDSIAASAWGSGASRSLGLPIYGTSKPGPWLLPG